MSFESDIYELFIKMKMIPQIEASMIIRLESMKMKKYRCLSCELEYGIAPILQLMGRVYYLIILGCWSLFLLLWLCWQMLCVLAGIPERLREYENGDSIGTGGSWYSHGVITALMKNNSHK